MIVLIFEIILTVVLLKYLMLLAKRIVLIRQLKKFAKQMKLSLKWMQNPFLSTFFPSGKVDFVLDACYAVTVLSTPFKRVRYHFYNRTPVETVEIIAGRKAVYIINPRWYKGFASLDRIITLKKYRLNLGRNIETACEKKVLMVYPVPLELSVVKANRIDVLGNNDIICGDYIVSTKSNFFELIKKDIEK